MYARFSHFLSSAFTSFAVVSRTRCVHIEFHEPAFSNRSVVSTPFRFRPTSTRVCVVGYTIANCLLRRKLT